MVTHYLFLESYSGIHIVDHLRGGRDCVKSAVESFDLLVNLFLEVLGSTFLGGVLILFYTGAGGRARDEEREVGFACRVSVQGKRGEG